MVRPHAVIDAAGPVTFLRDGSLVCGGKRWAAPQFRTGTKLPPRAAKAHRFAVSAHHLAAYVTHPDYSHEPREVILLEASGAFVGELCNARGPVHKTYPFTMYGLVAIAFSPDGTRIASTIDHDIVIYDVATRLPIHTLEPHGFHAAVDSDDNEYQARDTVDDLVYSPGGKVLASLACEGTIVLWDAATGARLRTLPRDEQPPDITFAGDPNTATSADGRYRAVATGASTTVFDLSGTRDRP